MTPFYDRLFRPEKMHYERLGHCVSKPNGPVSTIDGYLDHYPFSKGLTDWVARHNLYSTQEAQQIIQNRRAGKTIGLSAVFKEKDARERRRILKEFYYRLPVRPLVKFFVMYVLKCGFMDGTAGLTYSSLMGFYELMIVLKTEELEQTVSRGI
jgi:hypothetical protein